MNQLIQIYIFDSDFLNMILIIISKLFHLYIYFDSDFLYMKLDNYIQINPNIEIFKNKAVF